MSEYTIVNFIPTEPADKFQWIIESATDSTYVRVLNDNSVVLSRKGGNHIEETKSNLISQDSGVLLYDAPIEIGANTGEFIGSLVVDYYEDTGTHHESELYKIYAFTEAQKIDEKVTHSDRTGEKLDSYYNTEHGIHTALRPP